MAYVGPDNTLFSDKPITPQQAEAFVQAINEKVLPTLATQSHFEEYKRRFEVLLARLGNSLNELNGDLLQLRNEIWATLVTAFGGLVPRAWPQTQTGGHMLFADSTRDLMLMLMGLSLGRMYRAKLPAELQTLPEAMPFPIFFNHVFPFAVSMPGEELYRGLVAQCVMASLVYRTVKHPHMVFDLSKNFKWDQRTNTGSAVYTFDRELRHWPFSLVANSGVKFGQLPAISTSSEIAVWVKDMQANAQTANWTYNEMATAHSLKFKAEVLRLELKHLDMLAFVSKSADPQFRWVVSDTSKLSQSEQTFLDDVLHGAPEEQERKISREEEEGEEELEEVEVLEEVEEEEGKETSVQTREQAMLQSLRREYDEDMAMTRDSFPNANLVKKIAPVFIKFRADGNRQSAVLALERFRVENSGIVGPLIAELMKTQNRDEQQDALESTLQRILTADSGMHDIADMPLYIQLREADPDIISRLLIPVGQNAEGMDKFLHALRKTQARGPILAADLAGWIESVDTQCDQPKERLVVWAVGQLLAWGIQNPRRNPGFEEKLLKRLVKLHELGYLPHITPEELSSIDAMRTLAFMRKDIELTNPSNMCLTAQGVGKAAPSRPVVAAKQEAGPALGPRGEVPKASTSSARREAERWLEAEYDKEKLQVDAKAAKMRVVNKIFAAQSLWRQNKLDAAREKIREISEPPPEVTTLLTALSNRVVSDTTFYPAMEEQLALDDGLYYFDDIFPVLFLAHHIIPPVRLFTPNVKDLARFLPYAEALGNITRSERPIDWKSSIAVCHTPEEKYSVWVLSQALIAAVEKGQVATESFKKVLFARFEHLKTAGYLEHIPVIGEQLKLVQSQIELMRWFKTNQESFKTAVNGQCLTEPGATFEEKEREQPVVVTQQQAALAAIPPPQQEQHQQQLEQATALELLKADYTQDVARSYESEQDRSFPDEEAAKELGDAYRSFLDFGYPVAAMSLRNSTLSKITAIFQELEKAPDLRTKQSIFQSRLETLWSREKGFHLLQDLPRYLTNYVKYISEPLIPVGQNAKGMESFLNTLRKTQKTDQLAEPGEVKGWSVELQRNCPPQEQYVVWVLGQIIALAIQENFRNRGHERTLFNRVQQLNELGWLSQIPTLEGVTSKVEMMTWASSVKDSFRFIEPGKDCFTTA